MKEGARRNRFYTSSMIWCQLFGLQIEQKNIKNRLNINEIMINI